MRRAKDRAPLAPAAFLAVAVALLLGSAPRAAAGGAELPWLSAGRCRIVLALEARRAGRSNSPAAVELDLAAALSAAGIGGEPDEDSLEVMAYDRLGAPAVFDSERRVSGVALRHGLVVT